MLPSRITATLHYWPPIIPVCLFWEKSVNARRNCRTNEILPLTAAEVCENVSNVRRRLSSGNQSVKSSWAEGSSSCWQSLSSLVKLQLPGFLKGVYLEINNRAHLAVWDGTESTSEIDWSLHEIDIL